MPATQRKCTHEGLTLDVDRHYIGSVTATTHQEKGIITLESNPSRGTVLPAPHGKVKNILHKYDLPCPEFLLKNIRNIKQVEYWKIKCKQGIAEFWNNNTKREVSEKSTLKYLQLQENPSKVPHQVWAGSKHSPFASQKAIVKAKLLTGTLRL